MGKIVLISCASKKLCKKTRAEELYNSPLFKLNINYAKSLNPDKIFILSAKYGLLSLDEKIEPYDLTLNNMKDIETRNWAQIVLSSLKLNSNLDKDEFVFLAGEKYRRYLTPHLKNYSSPLERLGIGKQLKFLKDNMKKTSICQRLHKLFNGMERLSFPFDNNKIPKNGIYVLFEKNEKAHDQDRIVRIGTHTGENQLPSRIKQHFVNKNKDRSIFRKNIGRALLNKRKDDFLDLWELDLTTRESKDKFSGRIDFIKQDRIEEEVSDYIKENFSFVVFEIIDKQKRLEIESMIISTISHCKECPPSENWLGFNSPKEKIRKSGLWLVNELWKEPLNEGGFKELEGLITKP